MTSIYLYIIYSPDGPESEHRVISVRTGGKHSAHCITPERFKQLAKVHNDLWRAEGWNMRLFSTDEQIGHEIYK
jgi:hypothetical protein